MQLCPFTYHPVKINVPGPLLKGTSKPLENTPQSFFASIILGLKLMKPQTAPGTSACTQFWTHCELCNSMINAAVIAVCSFHLMILMILMVTYNMLEHPNISHQIPCHLSHLSSYRSSSRTVENRLFYLFHRSTNL